MTASRGAGYGYAILLALLAWSIAPGAEAREIVHVVSEGQNLGMIARRYHTTVEAIAKQNHLEPGAMLRPGQKLEVHEVPEQRRWREFLAALEARKKGLASPSSEAATRAAPTAAKASKPPRKAEAAPAKTKQPAKTEQPARTEQPAKTEQTERPSPKARPTEEPQRAERLPGRRAAKQVGGEPSKPAAPSPAPAAPASDEDEPAQPSIAAAWARQPKRPGHVVMMRYGETFRGPLVDARRRVVGESAKKMDRLLRSLRDREQKEIDRRLLQRIADLSDYFGGRTIVVVSGYRPRTPKQFTKNSRHNHGRAIDLRVVGVPVRAVFDHCRTLRETGCGHYPNSEFVHVDVRDVGVDWTDYSLPGKPPRYAKKRRSSGERADEPARAAKAAAGDDEPPAEER